MWSPCEDLLKTAHSYCAQDSPSIQECVGVASVIASHGQFATEISHLEPTNVNLLELFRPQPRKTGPRVVFLVTLAILSTTWNSNTVVAHGLLELAPPAIGDDIEHLAPQY